ncbi:MAG TPA: hypothetical protein VFQ35_22355, partial [Polyangiaceae bacterium]|nr:hypothetical protein [Polyangiaceae bacterium]
MTVPRTGPTRAGTLPRPESEHTLSRRAFDEPRRRRLAAVATLPLFFFLEGTAHAQSTPSAATPVAPSAATPEPAPAAGSCIERLPEGKARPKLTEKMASRGITGHAALLELVIEHGPGETVLPSGIGFQSSSDEYKALEAAHFFLPDPKGPAKPSVQRTQTGDKATTTVKLWFLPLPPKPGRNELTLPSLPIAISRASGERMTLCTSPHTLSLEEPTANEANPEPKGNPPARIQREEWTAAKQVTIAAAIALVLGALLVLLWQFWRKRPRALPPPPPKRPPWETAFEALHDLRLSGLLSEQRYGEFYDRASDVVRRYLGDVYGYDGLESTTREALAALRRISMPMDVWVSIQEFMQDADLVKFARNDPTEAQCASALTRA